MLQLCVNNSVLVFTPRPVNQNGHLASIFFFGILKLRAGIYKATVPILWFYQF